MPRLLAIAKLFANADEYNIHLQHIPNRPYFEVVDIKSPLDLNKAAQLANTPLYTFLKLNPGFNRSSTAPDGPHRLLVPVEQAQTFKRNLAMLPYSERVTINQYDEEQVAENRPQEHYPREETLARQEVDRPTFVQYQVKSDENQPFNASKNYSTIKSVRLANQLASNSVRSEMNVRTRSVTKSNNLPMLATASKTKSANIQVYSIKKGDTFFNISQRFSVTPKEIANWNNITLKTALIPGRKLSIKSENPQLASVSTSIRLISYKVGKGDTLTQISRKFNVSVSDLKKSNAATLVRGLQPGQKLKVFVDSSQSSS